MGHPPLEKCTVRLWYFSAALPEKNDIFSKLKEAIQCLEEDSFGHSPQI
jgi:hypothetical protein